MNPGTVILNLAKATPDDFLAGLKSLSNQERVEVDRKMRQLEDKHQDEFSKDSGKREQTRRGFLSTLGLGAAGVGAAVAAKLLPGGKVIGDQAPKTPPAAGLSAADAAELEELRAMRKELQAAKQPAVAEGKEVVDKEELARLRNIDHSLAREKEDMGKLGKLVEPKSKFGSPEMSAFYDNPTLGDLSEVADKLQEVMDITRREAPELGDEIDEAPFETGSNVITRLRDLNSKNEYTRDDMGDFIELMDGDILRAFGDFEAAGMDDQLQEGLERLREGMLTTVGPAVKRRAAKEAMLSRSQIPFGRAHDKLERLDERVDVDYTSLVEDELDMGFDKDFDPVNKAWRGY